ncbi:ABC transporter permease [Sulfitobacter sp. F26204]|uniref:ABC transporter permease n=1 Tax=Sulfitobacter sp. F26204 TaxID=2996014 RepID=UPI00225E677B|nr:ABC transporter permease [Sulfitobacter sp. F26204]MCX7560362.1 ABC transporter permease [Sulfitobacter sp. F26204]
MMMVSAAIVVWALGWWINVWLANGTASDNRVVMMLIPAVFGLTVVIVWELLVRGYAVNPVILPAPSAILERMLVEGPRLWADFHQTIIKGAMTGYVIGGLAALGIAVLADRSDFLTRGILPVGSFMAALPIVGIAPIFVKWFGSDWESKAAVVAVMVFFPILVNTVAGLRDTQPMQRDLMRTYGAGYWPTLIKLRLPSAMPFIFNGLKIATTLALIGAIVAEFFGSPTVGMGFRISTSFGQLALDMVWAEIVIAAIAGSAFYGVMTLIEKRVTFWHPSQR